MGFSAVALAITAYSAYESGEANRDARQAAGRRQEAEAKARQAEGRINEMQAQRDRVSQLREARIARAQVIGSTTNSGLGAGTSGTAGGVSSITSQASGNIGTINQVQDFAAQASAFHNQAAQESYNIFRANSRAQDWQAIGGVASGAFGQAGGWTNVKDWANKNIFN